MIEARGLTKRFRDKAAVEDLTFTAPSGAVTGFVGPNGAGKSTAMRLMLGLAAGEGETLYDGRPLAALPDPSRVVGALLDSRSFHPKRSARNHLLSLAALSGVPASRADECLKTVGLEAVGDKPPKGFSLGMAQRLGLAAALIGDPRVLILDEPANGLDPQTVTWLRTFLRSLADEGRTVFLSSHLLTEMALLADHLVVIGRGRLIAEAGVDEFVRQHTAGQVVLRTPHADRVVAPLRAAGAEITTDGEALVLAGISRQDVADIVWEQRAMVLELSTRHGSLEEAYLSLTGAAVEFGPRQATEMTGSTR
ncbi:ATP-binding cassette domain-containing protein [Streptomyces erythrochromogenes]|uniref:ATP-binding cassette domain-containing protein n=1 Tax=Streptomyces erythrochromogenes TaxID=285574 RepID=UPI0034401F3A